METLKKFRISYKVLMWLGVVLLVMLLLPMLALGRYAVPSADDFGYGCAARLVFEDGGSVFSVLAAALGKVGRTYLNWQGSFSAVFLMAVQPAIFSETLYWVTPVLMLLTLVLSTFYFCKTVFCLIFHTEKEFGIIAATAIAGLCTQLVPSPVQAFYWYNGSIYYVFFYSLSLAAAALGIKYYYKGGTGRLILFSILCAILGGGNYVTAFSCSLLAASALILLALEKNEGWKKLTVPALFLFISFIVSMAAPGNRVRAAGQGITPDAFSAILISFKSCFVNSCKWFSIPLLAVLLFLAPVFWNAAAGSDFNFRCPMLVSLYSFCLLAAMYCPPVYALGEPEGKRFLNIIYFAYILLFVLNFFYWLGWTAKRFGLRRASLGSASIMLTALLLTYAVLSSLFAVKLGQNYCSAGALGTLRSGEAREYYECAHRRFEILNDDSVRDAELEAFGSQPYMLYFDDATSDPKDWRNRDMSSFYQKESVIVLP
ncbi:MAG: DUF6056 family protein [Candidatus Limivicinus sp.]